MRRRKPIVLNGAISIPDGFASEEDEANFWDMVEIAGTANDALALLAGWLPEPRAEGELPIDGDGLRRWREELQFSEDALGAELGMSQTTIAAWERGSLPIEHPQMLRLALEGLARLRMGKSR